MASVLVIPVNAVAVVAPTVAADAPFTWPAAEEPLLPQKEVPSRGACTCPGSVIEWLWLGKLAVINVVVAAPPVVPAG